MTCTKTKKGRYLFKWADGFELVVWRDSYTGMWRAKQDGGPVDWIPHQRTLAEVKHIASQMRGE